MGGIELLRSARHTDEQVFLVLLQGVALHRIHSALRPVARRTEHPIQLGCHAIRDHGLSIAPITAAKLVEKDVDNVEVAPDRFEYVTANVDEFTRTSLLLQEVGILYRRGSHLPLVPRLIADSLHGFRGDIFWVVDIVNV